MPKRARLVEITAKVEVEDDDAAELLYDRLMETLLEWGFVDLEISGLDPDEPRHDRS